MRIVAVSDTHMAHGQLQIPECDLLIHSGDWTYQGHIHEVRDFAKWLDKQPAKHIVIIPGNHEKTFEACYPESRHWISDFCPRANLLVHESVEIEGIKIFGSPWTPYFFDWAYNAARSDSEQALYRKPLIKDIWATIPDDTDILVTHGPPYNILDHLPKNGFLGCRALFDRVMEIKPKIHIFGHIHYAYGHKEFNGTKFYNAANLDERYKVANLPHVIDYGD